MFLIFGSINTSKTPSKVTMLVKVEDRKLSENMMEVCVKPLILYND